MANELTLNQKLARIQSSLASVDSLALSLSIWKNMHIESDATRPLYRVKSEYVNLGESPKDYPHFMQLLDYVPFHSNYEYSNCNLSAIWN